ncbi:MAG: hypothetical protein EOO72_05740, partial [Myxococcaceae bacterium]
MTDDPLTGLDDIPWHQLATSGCGHATELPRVLRALATTRDPETWLMEVYPTLPSEALLTHCHGPYVSEAAAPAVPFLVALLPLAPDGRCVSCLLYELEAIAAGVVTLAEEWRAQRRQLSWWKDLPEPPLEEELAQEREAHRLREQARLAVRQELERILAYLDHPDAAARSMAYALCQALPEERARFEPLLWKRLEQEQDDHARSGLLLVLDGEATSQEARAQHPGYLPLPLLLGEWESRPHEEARYVVAYLLVRRLGDSAPAACFPVLARALGRPGVTLGSVRPEVWSMTMEAYMPLREECALEAILDVLTTGAYAQSPAVVGLLLHALSGSAEPSPWLMVVGNPPVPRRDPDAVLTPWSGPVTALQRRTLHALALSDRFWPWGGAMLEAYGLPSVRRELAAWLQQQGVEITVPPEPRLGIYWLVNGKVESFSQPMSEVRPVDMVRDTDLGHADTWPRVVGRHPELRGREYFEVPRGRVLFVECETIFRVFMPSREAAQKELVAQVVAA